MLHGSWSWRLTAPLRWANRWRRSLFAALNRSLARSRSLVYVPPRDLPRHAALWVLNRPRLAAVGRNVLARFPRLRSLLRRHVIGAPSLAQTPTVPPPRFAQELELSEDAARVLRELQRAINR
jgi:hypothetical protein